MVFVMALIATISLNLRIVTNNLE